MVDSGHGVANSRTRLSDFIFTFKIAQKGVTLSLKVDVTENFNHSEWDKDIEPALNLPPSTIHTIYRENLESCQSCIGSTSNKVVFFCSRHTAINTVGFHDGSASKDSACNAGDIGGTCSISRSERSSEEGNGNPLQYSCLRNPTDRGAWEATVHRSAKSDTTEWIRNENNESLLLEWIDGYKVWCSVKYLILKEKTVSF